MAVVQVAWALAMPPFTVPDEAEHFSYVQSLAENGERPPDTGNDPLYSSEVRAARDFARTGRTLPDGSHKPAWEPAVELFWDAAYDELPRDDIEHVGPQANHPPLYYGYETVAYAAASGGDAFDRLYVMRLWSGLLMLVTTAGAWLLVGELTRRDRLLQLAGATCVGFQPMATFMSSGVNPDGMLFATYSLALWLMARVLLRGPSRAAVAGLVAAAAGAALAKPAGLALVPAVALVLAIVALRHGGRRARVAVAGAAAGGAALLAAGMLAAPGLVADRTPVELGPDKLKGFATYLWDFYLPRLPFQHEYEALSADTPVWTVWVEFAWASFGFLETQFPDPVYVVLAAVSVGVFVAAAVALRRRRFEPGRAFLAVAALTVAALVLGLHWADFQAVDDPEFSHRSIQGRYLLPLMPLVAVAVAAALSNLGRRRALAAALVMAGMAVLQLASLSLVTARYFA